MGGFASILGGGGRKASRPIQIIRNVTPPVTVAPVSPPVVAQDTSAEDEGRIAAILRRSKGRAETVLTSFRGLLDEGAPRPARKSLLGE